MNPSEMRVLKIGNDIICTKMKRLGTLISITALLVACQSEQEDPSVITRPAISQEEAESVFYGTMETGQETKVYADEYLNVRWNANDKVSIFAKQDINQEYRFAGDDGANAGEFARGSQEGTGTGSSLPYNYAIYPYSSATSISAEGVLSVVLPADQTQDCLTVVLTRSATVVSALGAAGVGVVRGQVEDIAVAGERKGGR